MTISYEDRLAVRLLRAGNVLFCRVYHRLELRSPCPLPRRGAAIVVANHISGLDPLLIQSVSPRLVTWMMTRDFYDLPALNWIFRVSGMIPVEGGGRDLASTRRALRTLHDGGVLGIFPQGKIERRGTTWPFQTGAAMMAIRTGVPVYPAHIEGTQREKVMGRAFLEPQRTTLAFGRPLRFTHRDTSRESLEQATAAIESAIARLRCEPDSPPRRRDCRRVRGEK